MRPSARIRAAIAPLTQPSCHQSHDEPAEFEKPAESGKSWKHQLQARNERESGGLASGSYLWRRWRRGARPSDRWSPGSRERSRTVPGGRGPSTDRPAAWSTDLQSLTESVSKKKKSLQGTKQREDDRREKRCSCHNQSVFRSLIYVTCHTAGSQGPCHPRKFFRRCSSEVWRLHPDLWQLWRTEEPSFFFFFFFQRDVYTLPFGRNYVCFSEFVPARVTNRWEDRADSSERSVSPGPLPKHIPASWHDVLLCNYCFT